MYLSTFVVMLQGPSGRSNKGGEGVQEGSVAPAGRKTLETLGAADSIAEALEMAANERKRHEVSLAFLISSINSSAYILLLLLLLVLLLLVLLLLLRLWR